MGQDSQASAWGALSSIEAEPAVQPVTLPPLRVGKVLSDTFTTFSANFIRFWAVSLLTFLPLVIGSVVMFLLIAISGVASIYTNLRAAKEGASADDIAKVFE